MNNIEKIVCALCQLPAPTRQHHLIPRCKKGTETIPCCFTCENFLHRQWNHNQLRDTYNNIETILEDKGFQKFLRWRRKQPPTVLFKSDKSKYRDKNKYH